MDSLSHGSNPWDRFVFETEHRPNGWEHEWDEGTPHETRAPRRGNMADEWEVPWQKLSKIITPGKFSKQELEQAAKRAGEVVDLTCEKGEEGGRNPEDPVDRQQEEGWKDVADAETNPGRVEVLGTSIASKGKDADSTALGKRGAMEAGQANVQPAQVVSLNMPQTYVPPPIQPVAGSVHPMMPMNPTYQFIGTSYGRPEVRQGSHAYFSNWRPQPKKRRKLKTSEIDKKIVDFGYKLLFETIKSHHKQEDAVDEEEETPKTHQFF